jgi:hypothetical protein
MRFRAAIALLAVLLVGVPRLFDPSTWVLFEAMRALGPISGWRCAHGPTYTYDPRRETADDTLLSQAPEDVLAQIVPGLEFDKVEANLRSGDTSVWTRVVADDGADEESRVYVLSPGRLQTIFFDLTAVPTTICNSHLGDWRIVAEHRLS